VALLFDEDEDDRSGGGASGVSAEGVGAGDGGAGANGGGGGAKEVDEHEGSYGAANPGHGHRDQAAPVACCVADLTHNKASVSDDKHLLPRDRYTPR